MRSARIAGILIQAVVLGILLMFALARLLALRSGARVFHYEAF